MGAALLSWQWRVQERELDRARGRMGGQNGERRKGGRSASQIDERGQGGAHARARGSHAAYGTCTQSNDGAAPEAFKIDQKSTESPNFSPPNLLMYCCSGSNFLTKSCRTICGEQLFLKDHGLVQHGYEDTASKVGYTKLKTEFS